VVIEATENLLSPDWRSISTNTITAATSLKFSDSDASKFSKRFYRAVAK